MAIIKTIQCPMKLFSFALLASAGTDVSHTTEIVGQITLAELVICHIRIKMIALSAQAQTCEGTEIFKDTEPLG